MAATKPNVPTEASAAPPGVSYAQAAKRKAQSLPSASHSVGNSHEAAETQKDTTLAKPSMSWAEETEESLEPVKKDSVNDVIAPEISTVTKDRPQPSQTPSESQATAVSAISTPEFGISSTSTLAEKEDTSSIPNTSSESTWENKSQASNSAEKSSSNVKESSTRNEDAVKVSTPLKDAPPPPVNIWQQRAKEQQAAKASLQPSPAKPVIPAHPAAESSNKTRTPAPKDGTRSEPRRKARSASAGRESSSTVQGKDRKRSVDAGGKGRDDGKFPHNRRASRFDNDAERGTMRKNSSKDTLLEQEEATVSTEPPSVNDEMSWPAMGANVPDEKQRKPQEKEEKERTPMAGSKSHSKQEWVQIQIPPANYLFETPLPNTNPRRGGRGGSRGGRENGNRGASHTANGYMKGEKSAGGENLASNDEPSNNAGKRGRPDGEQVQTGGQNAATRTSASKGSSDSQSPKAATFSTTATIKTSTQGGVEFGNKEAQAMKDSQPSHTHQPRQSGAPKWKQAQRSGDLENDRRRESEADAKRESRRHSNVTQTEEPRERRSTITGESSQSSRYDRYDRREDFSARASWKEGGHETYPMRGNGRGRGRGSRRGGFSHGFHQGNHSAASSVHGSAYSFPNSPTYQQQFGNTSQPPRGYRGPRSQAPANGEFGQASGPYPSGPGQVPPLQTWFDPGVYEYQMMQSMSAMPWQPQMNPVLPVKTVIQQLEYYLSLENMLKDTWLRSHMDSKGYLDLEVVANFPRLQIYEMELIRLACYESSEIDYKISADGKHKIRKSTGWEQWVLDMEKRDDSAKNDGSDQLLSPPKPQPAQLYFDAFQYGPQSPISPGQMPSGQGGYVMNSPYPPMARMSMPSYPFSAPPDFGHPSEGFPERQPQEQLSQHIPNGEDERQEPTAGSSSVGHSQQEHDSFPDDKIPGLNVVYRIQDANNNRAPFHNHDTRTFSNGSLDGGDIMPEAGRGGKRRPSPHKNEGIAHDGENGVSHNDRAGSPTSHPLERSSNTQQVEVLWVKDSSTPIDHIPPNTETEPYQILHVNALNDRFGENAEPCSKNMLVLYQFWSHFLIRNFNTIMYNEFRKFAFEDAARESTIGIHHLIEFYGKSLSSQLTIRERVARHYAGFVKREDQGSSRPAFQQLRKQWRDGALNLKNRKKISEFISPELKAELES